MPDSGSSGSYLDEPYIHIQAESPSDRSTAASYERLDDIPIREDIVHPNGIPFPARRTPHTSDAHTKPHYSPPIESPPKGLPDEHIKHNRHSEVNSQSESASAPPSPPRGPADLRLSVSTLSLSRPRHGHRHSSDRDRDRDRDHDRPRRRHTYDSNHDRQSGGSGQHGRSGRRHTTSSSKQKQYREYERILLSVSSHSKDMRQVLTAALDQLEESRARATRAQRLALELTQRTREADDERLAITRQGGVTREELGMYKVQLANAQAQLDRAQERLKLHEEQRRDAEAAAARARDTARKLEQERLVWRAREEGRRLGFNEGIRAGKRVGFYNGREEGYDEERRRRPLRVIDDNRSLQDDELVMVEGGGAEERYDGYPLYDDPIPEETGPPGLNDREIPSQNDLTVPGPADSEIIEEIQIHPDTPPSRHQRYRPRPRRRASGSGSESGASTTTLPIASRDFNPNHLSAQTRAPRIPTPNIPSVIPEVVNTEPSSSRTPSRRGSGFVDDDGANVHRTSSQRSHQSHRSHRSERGPPPIPAPSDSSQPIPVPITPESMAGYDDQEGGYVRGPPPHPSPSVIVNDRGNAGSTPGPRMAPLRRECAEVAASDGGDLSGDESVRRTRSGRRMDMQDVADYIRGDGANEERRAAAVRAARSPPRTGPPRPRPVRLSVPAPLAPSQDQDSGSATETPQTQHRSRNQSMSSTGTWNSHRRHPSAPQPHMGVSSPPQQRRAPPPSVQQQMPQQPYVPPPQQQYVPPPQQQYVPPPRQQYVPPPQQQYVPSPQQQYVPPPQHQPMQSTSRRPSVNNGWNPYTAPTGEVSATPGSGQSTEPIAIAIQTPSGSTPSQPRMNSNADEDYLTSKYKPPQLPTPSSTAGRSPSALSHPYPPRPDESSSTFFAGAGPDQSFRSHTPDGSAYGSARGDGAWNNPGQQRDSRGGVPSWERGYAGSQNGNHTNYSNHSESVNGSGPGSRYQERVQPSRSSGHLRQNSVPQATSSGNGNPVQVSRSASTSSAMSGRGYPQHQQTQYAPSGTSAGQSEGNRPRSPFYADPGPGTNGYGGPQALAPGPSVPPPRSPSQQSFSQQGSYPSGFVPAPSTSSPHHSRSNSRSQTSHPQSSQPYPQQYPQPARVPVSSSSNGSTQRFAGSTGNNSNNGDTGYAPSSSRSRQDRPPPGPGPPQPGPSSPNIYAPHQSQPQSQNQHQRYQIPPQGSHPSQPGPHQYAGSMTGPPSTDGRVHYGNANESRRAASPSNLSASGAGASTSRFYGGNPQVPNANGMPAGQQPVSYASQGPPPPQNQPIYTPQGPGSAQISEPSRSASTRSRSGSEAPLPHPEPSVHRSPYRGPTMVPPSPRTQMTRSPSPRRSPRPAPPVLPIPVPGNVSAVSLAQTASYPGQAGPSSAVYADPSSNSSPPKGGGGIFRRLSKKDKKKDKGKQKVDINRISAPISPVIGAAGVYPSPRASPGGFGSRSPSPVPGLGMSLAAGGSPFGSDISLPMRPGSPYKHYNPNESLGIEGLASASAEKLAMYPYR